MEYTELLQSLNIVIEKSFDNKNKIKNMSAEYIKNDIHDDLVNWFIDNNNLPIDFDQSMVKFIDVVKMRRPGYVNQDIINIVRLGVSGQLGDEDIFCYDSLRKWFYEYGIKRIKIDGKDIGTKRNQLLKTAYEEIQADKNKYREMSGSELILYNMKRANNFRDNYPTISAIMRGEIKIGRKIETLSSDKQSRDPLYK